MYSYTRKILIAVVFAAFSGFSKGEVSLIQQDTTLSKTLSEVVVSASRFATVILETPEAIRIADIPSLQKFQLRSAPEALRRSPGVFVQKTNHGGGSPFLRGLTGNQTLLMLDGIRMSNSTYRYGPNQYFNTIDVFSIDKMEVLRGSGSVQYGSDAIGGTVQAFTRNLSFSGDPVWGSSLFTRVASAGMEQSLNGSINYSTAKAAFRGGITWRNFGDLKGGDTTGIQSPTGYDEFDFDIKGKVALSETADITLVMQSVHQTGVPVYHKVVLENYAINSMDPQDRKLGYVKVNQRFNEGVLKSASLTASWQQTEESRESRKNNSTVTRYEKDKVRSLGFIAEAFTSENKFWSASSGAELYNDFVNSNRIDTDLSTGSSSEKRGLYPDNSTMTSLAAFSLHTISLQRWIFTAGARLNAFIINVDDTGLGATQLTPSAIVGNLAITRKINNRSNLFVSANSGFRAPNIDDLGTLGIVDFRYETPNFNLEPEHSFQYQAGYKFLNQLMHFEVFIYRNELRNLIVRNIVPGDTIDGYPVYRKENIEKAYIHGIETAIDFQVTRSVKLGGNLTYTYGQNITKDEPVRRIPPLFGSFTAEYNYKKLWIGAEWIAAGKQERLAAGDKSDNRIPQGGTPGWNIFNLSVDYNQGIFDLGVSLQNLFNTDYRYHGSGVNGAGRMALFSITINLGTI